MAVTMDVWSTSNFGGYQLESSGKKKEWGEDQQKLLQLMMGQSTEDNLKSRHVTLDLLGGSPSTTTSMSGGKQDHIEQSSDLELDMDMPPPVGWEKRLDLKLGRVYFVQLSTGRSTSEHPSKHPSDERESTLQSGILCWSDSAPRWDLQSEIDRIDMKRDLNLELNLGGIAVDHSGSKSLCTIEAVQEALTRSKKRKQQHVFLSQAASTSSSSSSLSNCHTRTAAPDAVETSSEERVVLTACKRCLMYVMLTRSDPKCPKCGSAVVIENALHLHKSPRLDFDL